MPDNKLSLKDVKGTSNISVDDKNLSLKGIKGTENIDTNIGYSSPARGAINEEVAYPEDPITEKDLAQGYMSASLNQFMVELNNVQVGGAKYGLNQAKRKNAELYDLLSVEQDPANREQLEALKKNNLDEMSSLQEEVDSQEQDASEYYVNKIYSIKKELVDSKGTESGFLEKVKYDLIPGFGSQIGLVGASIVGQLAKKIVPTLVAGATGGPVGEGVALASAIATAGLAALAARKVEAESEVGSAVDGIESNMVSQYLDLANKKAYQESLVSGEQYVPITKKDIPEGDYNAIIKKANEGSDRMYWENMALAIPDIAEAVLLPGLGSLGKVSTGAKMLGSTFTKALDYNKYTRLAGNIGGLALRTEAEKFEEGFQYAAQKRQEADAYDWNHYSEKGFIGNVLTDSYDTVTSMDLLPFKWLPGEVRGRGRYAENKEFQSAEESGGLLAMFQGGLGTAINTYSDIKKLKENQSLLQSDDAISLDGKIASVHDDIVYNAFKKGSVNHLLEGVRNLYGNKDENGNEIYSEEELDGAIKKIKTSYNHFKEAEELVNNIPKDNWLGFKSSPDQAAAIEKSMKMAYSFASKKEYIDRELKNANQEIDRASTNAVHLETGMSHSELQFLSTKHKIDSLDALRKKYDDLKETPQGISNDYANKIEYIDSYKKKLEARENLQEKLVALTEDLSLNKQRLNEIKSGKRQLPINLSNNLDKKVSLEIAGQINEDDNNEFITHLKNNKLKEFIVSKKSKHDAKVEAFTEAQEVSSSPLSEVADKVTISAWKEAGYITDGSEPLVIEVNGEKKIITFGGKDSKGKHILFLEGKKITKLPDNARIVPKSELNEGLTELNSVQNDINALNEELELKQKEVSVQQEANRENLIRQLEAEFNRQKELEDLFNNYQTLQELSPLQKVRYKGMIGFIKLDKESNEYYFEDVDTKKEYLIDKLINRLTKESQRSYRGKAYEFGVIVIPEENPLMASIELEDTSKGLMIKIDGKPYFNQYSKYDSAINRDADGNILSVTLHTYNGQPRTFKKFADEIAYSILLYLNSDEIKQNRTGLESGIDSETEELTTERENKSTKQSEKSKELELFLEDRQSKSNEMLSRVDEKLSGELKELISKIEELKNRKKELQAIDNAFRVDSTQVDPLNTQNNYASLEDINSFSSTAFKKSTLMSTTASEDYGVQNSLWNKALRKLDRNNNYYVKYFTSTDPEYGNLISEDALKTEGKVPTDATTVIKVILLDDKGSPLMVDDEGNISQKGKVLTEYIHTDNWVNNISEKAVVKAYVKSRLNSDKLVSNINKIKYPISFSFKGSKDILTFNNNQELLDKARSWAAYNFNIKRAEILRNIREGNPVFSRVKKISNGIPNTRNNESKPVIGTFVKSKDELQGIVINDGKSKNPIISNLKIGTPYVVKKNGTATPVKARNLSNNEVDVMIDVLDFTLNTEQKDPINSLSTVNKDGTTAGEIHVFNTKNNPNGSLISRLIWWGPSKTKAGKKFQIYYSGYGKGRMLHFGSEVIPVNEIKSSNELRLFLQNTHINVNKGVLENRNGIFNVPSKLIKSTITGESPSLEVEQYKSNEVSAYENFLLDSVLSTNIEAYNSSEPQMLSMYIELASPTIKSKKFYDQSVKAKEEEKVEEVVAAVEIKKPELNIGDVVMYDGTEATILKFTKGERATIEVNGKKKTNILISNLSKQDRIDSDLGEFSSEAITTPSSTTDLELKRIAEVQSVIAEDKKKTGLETTSKEAAAKIDEINNRYEALEKPTETTTDLDENPFVGVPLDDNTLNEEQDSEDDNYVINKLTDYYNNNIKNSDDEYGDEEAFISKAYQISEEQNISMLDFVKDLSKNLKC